MSDPSQALLVNAAIARLVGDDPLAPVILKAVALEHPDSFAVQAALALVVEPCEPALLLAKRLSSNRRERQHLVIVTCFVQNDVEHAALLAREHLAEFPDDVVVSWLTSQR
jgi:hypothetical protein